MKSIKRISQIILMITTGMILLIILINSQLSSAFKSLDYNDSIKNELTKSIESLDLPIKVLENIASQEITPEKEPKLQLAFIENTEHILNDTRQSLLHLENIQFDYIRILTYQVYTEDKNNYKIVYDDLYLMLNNIHDATERLIINNNLSDHTYLNPIVEDYQILIQLQIKFNSLFSNHVSAIRNTYIHYINFAITLLISMIVLLFVIILRFIYIDLNFIKRTYDQIDSKEYDINNVLLSKPFFNEEVEIHRAVKKLFNSENIALDFKKSIADTYLVDDVIDRMLIKTNEIMGVDRVGIGFVDYSNQTIITEYVASNYENVYLSIGYVEGISTSSLSPLLDTKNGIIKNNLMDDLAFYPDNPTLKLMIQEGILSSMTIPLILNQTVYGMVFLSSKELNHFDDNNLQLASKIVNEISGILNRAYLFKVLLSKITLTFAELVDKKDIETGSHIVRMIQYSTLIAEGVRLLNYETHFIDQKSVLHIERNASTHDIGKVGIPDYILKKPGKLDLEEFELMKTHSNIGADIFKKLNKDLQFFNSNLYDVAEEIARYHHERFDGTGYPEGRKGYDIPLTARIVALADVFDALTSKRVYKDAYSFEDAYKIVKESNGSHFDPVIVEAFDLQIEHIRKVYES